MIEEDKQQKLITEKFSIVNIEDEMKRSYIDYAMSVIVGRALPDVRDGLKPVHRRSLYTMYEQGMSHDKPYKKSARVVGITLGMYHPHGDISVYDSIVRMVQEFSLRYPLIDGQGNFGSIDGDSPAAMRYCITGDSLLLTDSGLIEIKEISSENEKNINIKVQNFQNIPKKAVKFFNSGEHDTIKLTTEQGYEIEGTYNHPILTCSYDKGYPHIKWKLLEEIADNDYVILNRNSNYFNQDNFNLKKYHTSNGIKKFKLPDEMNNELAYLLGALVAEGSFHNKQVLFCNSNIEYYNKIKESVYSQFEGIELYERKLKDCNCLEFSIYHKQVVEFLENIGLNKEKIPFSILCSKKEHISSFLSGLNKEEDSFSHKSEKLIKQLKIVLLNFGIVTTSPYFDNGCYKLKILDINFIPFLNENSNYFFDKVNIIQKTDKKKIVYSIKVDSECHSFTANGFINHNTEVRLEKIADEVLGDIDKDTVDFVPNYDDSLKEPSVLPCKLPNLLINGSTGIAVGMATNMPPHSLGEVIDGIKFVIEHPDAEINEIMQFIKGPDFPTYGFIYGRKGIIDAYTIGRGSIKMRARAVIEERKNKEQIIVTELPYQVNKAKLIEDIASLVRDKKISGITDLRDESDKDGIRIVMEISKQAQANIILNQLYSHTQLETSFGVINLALVNGEPKLLTLKDLITNYISHRKNIIIKRSNFELKKAKNRAHILEGLRIALINSDEVIKLIKASKSVDEARNSLLNNFSLSIEQVKAILDMKLQRLTGLEHEKIDAEYDELLKTISELEKLLGSEIEILELIKTELSDLKTRFADKRRTEIIDSFGEISTEDLIPKEDCVITISNSGYIKRIPVDAYKQQKRGGKGVIGMETKEEDFVSDLFIENTHDYILFFTDKGKVYWLKVYEIPSAGRQARGNAIVNLLQLEQGERINAYTSVSSFDEEHYLFMVTKMGIAKKTPLSSFSSPRKNGIIAISLDEGDELVSVKLTDGTKNIIIGTKHGKAVRFDESGVREVGRNTRGVKAVKLVDNDEVVSTAIVEGEATLLTITENGYGKRTKFEEYRIMKRGGQGVITIVVSERNGNVVDIRTVHDDEEIMVTTSKGIIIRVPVSGIRVQGRNTQGVRIMNVESGDRVVGVARLVKDEDENNGQMMIDEIE